jgi:DNA-binding beta-propeller fold protein YncE
VVVQVSPTAVTIGEGEQYQFSATVGGTTNTGISWSVSSPVVGNPTGTITPNGAQTAVFVAPNTVGAVDVKATSAFDSSQSATAVVTVGSAVDPTITAINPTIAAQGSVQQDLYVTGTNFFNTSTVAVGPFPNLTQVPTTFISTTLLRASIPANLMTMVGLFPIHVQRQNGDLDASATVFNLSVVPVRPAIVASSPDSVEQPNANVGVSITGGFFVNGKTTAQFNGQAVASAIANSRQMSVTIPAGNLSAPGLYPIVVQNSDALTAGIPSISATNLAVAPSPNATVGAPNATIAVGTSPSAVAVDYADRIAVVADTGSNSVTLVNLTSNSAGPTIPVGASPTGVAVDDLLTDPVALVINSKDQTVSAIDLKTSAVAPPVSVSIGQVANSPIPYAIGVNSLTHRAIVAYQSTNQATVLDVSIVAGVPTVSVVQQVGGALTSFGTGAKPGVAIDPQLNWAVITPGGTGPVNIVDLGRDPSSGDPAGRAPQVVGGVSLSTSLQGIGINPETHVALMTDPEGGALTTLSLLDFTVGSISFPTSEFNYVAAAVNPLANIGIAVNLATQTASIVDLGAGTVLQTMAGLGTSPFAVAIDPGSNEAVVVNQGGNSVSIISLSQTIPAIDPLQIVESSPAIAFTSATPLTFKVTGAGFTPGSQLLFDGTALPTADVTIVSAHQINATVPAAMLGSATCYIVQVQNPGGGLGSVSNVTELTVIQPVIVGSSPVGVAVDPDRDLAVVTNYGSGTASLVALTPNTPTGPNNTPVGAVGTIGAPVTVGASPEGVAVLPRLGVALVANNQSNNITLVDETATNNPQTGIDCPSAATASCGLTSVAINQDTGTAVITNIPQNSSQSSSVNFATISPPATAGGPAGIVAGANSIAVDQNPTAASIDPTLNLAAVTTAVNTNTVPAQTNSVDFISLSGDSIVGRAFNFQLPTGIVFDPVNQVFLVANSLQNNVSIVDPTTFNQTLVQVGINPTSVDYNFQTSTLVTINSVSNTMSVVDYVCTPTGPASACPNPRVRLVLGLGGEQPAASTIIGPNSIAIDPRLNLAVVVDEDNNRILLVPLPH